MIKIESKLLNFITKVIKHRTANINMLSKCHHIYVPNLSYYNFSTAKITKPQKQKTKQSNKSNQSPKQSKQSAKVTQRVDYGDQINSLLSKKELNEIDLVFLSKMLHMKSLRIQSQEDSTFIRKQIKKLALASFQNLISLIQLSNNINIIHYSNVLTHAFIKQFTNNKVELNKIQHFPHPFLKQVAFALFLQNFKKKIDQGAEVLKVFGTLMSNEELKKVDRLCCQNIKSMEIDSVVRFLNIFRQIAKKGLFVDLAGDVVLQKRIELSNKYIIMSLISFLELGAMEPVQKLQPLLISKIGGEKGLQHKQVLVVIQVFHKFKRGGAVFWQNIQKYIRQKQRESVFQNRFAILSGLTRNYIPRTSLFLDIVMQNPTLDFVKDLNEKQYIEFFLVLYFHFQHSKPAETVKIQPFIFEAIKSKQLKSVYLQIQYFFFFLFQKGSQKKQYLRKAYPNDMMITLVSLAYSIQETVDVTEARAYEQDVINRYTQQYWSANKKTIVAEEFIRYKLVSAREKEFKDQMM